MKISTTAIVSTSDMIRDYKACRDKAERLGKIFIFKNNQSDAVLFSVGAYERLSEMIEYAGHLEEKDNAKVLALIAKEWELKDFHSGLIRKDIYQTETAGITA